MTSRRTLEAECLRTKLEAWIFDLDYSERALREHFKLLSLDGCGLAGKPLAVGAAGRDPALPARHAAQRARPSRPARLTTTAPDAMVLDAVRSATWNWSSRCSRGRARNRRSSACSIKPARGWAADCCGAGCCGPRIDLAGDRSATGRGRADAVANDRALRNPEDTRHRSWIWSGCWRRSPSARPVRATCWRSAGRLHVIPSLRFTHRRLRAARRDSLRALDPVDEVSARILERHLGRAAGQPRRRRNHSRRLSCRTRRTARHQPQQPPVHRADRSARAGPHRNRFAEGPLQQRFRLLHRDLERRTCSMRRPITSASRRWSMRSDSPRPS